MLHPSRLTLGVLVEGGILRVFDLAVKDKVAEATLPASEELRYWAWVTEATTAIVTSKALYFWECRAGARVAKVVDRVLDAPGSAAAMVTDVRLSSNEKWVAITALTAEKDGRVTGNMQLYSIEMKASQPIAGHACTFATTTDESGSVHTFFIFANRAPGPDGSKLLIIETDVDGERPLQPAKMTSDVPFAAGADLDFAVSLEYSARYQMIYLTTKFGFLSLFHFPTGAFIFTARVSPDSVFHTVARADGSWLGLNRQGQVLEVAINETALLQHVLTELKDAPLARHLTSREGAADPRPAYEAFFESMLREGRAKAAAEIAALSPKGCLRTTHTMARLKESAAGGESPLLHYFRVLLKGQLSSEESMEMVGMTVDKVTDANRETVLAVITGWVREDHVTCTEELGDLLLPVNREVGMLVYGKCGAHNKVVAVLVRALEFERAVRYASEIETPPDWAALAESLLAGEAGDKETKARNVIALVAVLASGDQPAVYDIARVADRLEREECYQQACVVLRTYLRGNRPEDAALQTRLVVSALALPVDVEEGGQLLWGLTHFDQDRVLGVLRGAGMHDRAEELKRRFAAIVPSTPVARLPTTSPSARPTSLFDDFAIDVGPRASGTHASPTIDSILQPSKTPVVAAAPAPSAFPFAPQSERPVSMHGDTLPASLLSPAPAPAPVSVPAPASSESLLIPEASRSPLREQIGGPVVEPARPTSLLSSSPVHVDPLRDLIDMPNAAGLPTGVPDAGADPWSLAPVLPSVPAGAPSRTSDDFSDWVGVTRVLPPSAAPTSAPSPPALPAGIPDLDDFGLPSVPVHSPHVTVGGGGGAGAGRGEDFPGETDGLVRVARGVLGAATCDGATLRELAEAAMASDPALSALLCLQGDSSELQRSLAAFGDANYDRIFDVAKMAEEPVDWEALLLSMARTSANKAKAFAVKLVLGHAAPIPRPSAERLIQLFGRCSMDAGFLAYL